MDQGSHFCDLETVDHKVNDGFFCIGVAAHQKLLHIYGKVVATGAIDLFCHKNHNNESA